MHQNVPNIMFVIQVQGLYVRRREERTVSIHFYIKSCLNNIKEIIIIFMIYINCGCFFQSLVSPTKAKQRCRVSSEIVATQKLCTGAGDAVSSWLHFMSICDQQQKYTASACQWCSAAVRLLSRMGRQTDRAVYRTPLPLFPIRDFQIQKYWDVPLCHWFSGSQQTEGTYRSTKLATHHKIHESSSIPP